MSSSHPENSEEPSGLLSTLVAVFSGVLFGMLLSRLRSPQEDSESVSPQDYTREEEASRQIKSAVVPKIAPAPVHANQTNRSEEHTPRWKKIAEWSIAGATAGLFVVAILQFSVTREQVHTGQRAYLVFRHPTLTELPAQDQSPGVTVELENSGQTPAIDVRFSIIMFVANSPDAIHQMPDEVYVGYIGAGRELKPLCRLLTKLTQEQYDAITSKEVSLEGNRITVYRTKRLFVRAVVHYKDVFGVPGETTLCSVYSEEKELNGCITGGSEMKWGKQ